MSGVAPVLITLGDPAGIGPELVARAHLAGELHDAMVVGDPAVMARGLRACGAATTAGPRLIHPLDAVAQAARAAGLAHGAPASAPPWATLGQVDAPVWEALAWGAVDARCGAYAALCLQAAVGLARLGQGRAIVTAPIHKESLAAAG